MDNLSRSGAPRRPQWQGSSKRNKTPRDFRLIACVAASVVALTYLGPYFVAGFYALWLPRPAFRPKLLQPSRELLFPALIVADVLASVLWSVHPDVTARAALQFASMIGCTIIAARLVSVHSFIKGFTLGACAVLVLVIGITGGLPDDSALVGGLGSKNQVGEIAELGFYCALMLWFASRAIAWRLFLSAAPMGLCLVCLYYSHSATAEITLGAVLVMSFTAYFVGRIPARFRGAAFGFVVLCMLIVIVAGATLDLQSVGLQAVGKDVTLTGRTILWSAGIKTGMENPILGVGYDAFWVPGTPEAEKFWFMFKIPGRSGFHFHNLFINLFVDLGAVGSLLWGAFYLSTFGKATAHLLRSGHSVESIFYVGMSFMYLVRALTEVDTTTPYGTAAFMVFFVAIRVAALAKVKRPNLTTGGSTNRLLPPARAGAAIGG